MWIILSTFLQVSVDSQATLVLWLPVVGMIVVISPLRVFEVPFAVTMGPVCLARSRIARPMSHTRGCGGNPDRWAIRP